MQLLDHILLLNLFPDPPVPWACIPLVPNPTLTTYGTLPAGAKGSVARRA